MLLEREAAGARRQSPAKAWLRALESIGPVAGRPDLTLPGMIDELAARFGEAPALIGEDETLTYAELGRRCRQYAQWAIEQGIGRGDVVCLMMSNRPQYVAIWLGVTRAGGVVALLNTGLTGQALAHSISVANPAHLIAEPSLAAAVDAAGCAVDCRRWIADVAGENCELRWPVIERGRCDSGELAAGGSRSNGETALLIYTSGTTGLPKAAKISHRRVLEWGGWFAGMMDVRPDDRLYECLPLCHSTGGVAAVAAMLLRGASVVIRRRFSAGRFWADVADHGCTIFLYIGELCRYLLAAPPDPGERRHRLRLCAGNGLRGQIWESFADRFEIPQILEFYASTEGNVSLYNCEGRPGAIGRVPPFLAHRFPIALIACDPETGAPARGADGLCVACAPGAAGEAIGRIATGQGAGAAAFEGYTDAAATELKVLRHVFKPGDAWFRTGDLMRRDPAGFFYFVDRMGDTFRWKGENVSTTQVADAVSACPGVREAVVYGVAAPGAEGRAGMAAIRADADLSLADLHAHLEAALPHYARPVFLRLCDEIEATGTFKPVKARLVREGCDPRVVSDPLFFNDRRSACFVPLDPATYEQLEHAAIRL